MSRRVVVADMVADRDAFLGGYMCWKSRSKKKREPEDEEHDISIFDNTPQQRPDEEEEPGMVIAAMNPTIVKLAVSSARFN